MNKLQLYRLEFVVFFCGAILMIMEVVGSRVVSPYFGNSLLVWTNLIGVILGCLSVGYYYGGKVADKEATFVRLESLIFWGAFFLALTAFLKEPVLGMVQFQMGSDLRAASFLSILMLFGPSSILLGMVSPMAAKLKLISLTGSGTVVGSLYALSTLGSIIGTFVAGFILIPGFGNSHLLYGLSYGLVAVSVVAAWKINPRHFLLFGFIFTLFFLNREMGLFKLDTLADVDSLYNRILVRQYTDSQSRKVNMMSIDNAGIQSAVVVGNPGELYLDYTKNFGKLKLSSKELEKVLVIGGGGYSIPGFILERNEKSRVDVVEIDSEITRMARDFFYLRSDPRLNIYHQDARSFIQDTDETYDTIFLDAFNSLTPPPHLTTSEFMTDLKNHLSDNGLLLINMVTSLSGNKSLFFSAELATLKSVFRDVRIFNTNETNADEIQNVYVLAYNKESVTNKGVKVKTGENSKILTDDWSPVEYLTRGYYQ